MACCVNATDYGAVGNGTTDDTAAIKKALNAVSAKGGTVYLPAGVYRITSTVTIPPKCGLKGDGYTSVYGSANAATVIKKDGSFVGVSLTDDARLSDLQVHGHTGNGKDGISVIGGRSLIESVTSTSHGGHGIRIGSESGNNCNLWRMSNILSLGNNGSGIYVHDSAAIPNVNAGILIGADLRSNTGNGLIIENALDCTFMGVTSQHNGQIGIYLKKGARGHQFFGTYVEANSSGEFILDTGTERNLVFWFRSGIISSNIVNRGDANFIVERDSQDYNRALINYGININKLGITDPSISGVWRFQQNTANRDLDIILQNTGATPAFVNLTHAEKASGAEVGLRLQRLEINGGQPLRDFRHRQLTLDIPPLAKQTTTELSFAITGARLGDIATANPVGAPVAGLLWNAYVSGDNQVTVRFFNSTASQINPSPQTWKISTWRADSQ